jgi:lysophospholipase L1-like esterase
MVGTNDLAQGISVDETYKNYILIVEKLKDKNIQVFIQSTLECTRIKCSWRLRTIRELNEKLELYAKENDITYININTGLSSKDFGLLPEYTYDGTHLLGSGYVIWSQTIKPYIE